MDNRIKSCFLILCLSASILISLLGCSSTTIDSVSYKESDSGKTVTVSLNESFKLTLEASGSSSWNVNCTIDDESVIVQTSYETKEVVLAGIVAGNQIWTFEAVGTGTTTITNVYSGIHGKVKDFTLTVVVE